MENGRTAPLTSIVAAIGAHDRAIGRDNKLLWHIPDDLKRFKQLTLGHPVILGRKTFESIVATLGKSLPERQNIVVTRDTSYGYHDAIITHSLDEAIERARALESQEIFVCGGADLWRQALPQIDKLYLTLVYDTKPADTFFPEYEGEFTKETFRENRKTRNGLQYTWVDLER